MIMTRTLIQESHAVPSSVIEAAAYAIYHNHFEGTEIAAEDAQPIAEIAVCAALEALAGVEER